MEGQYERVSQSRELLYSVPAALCEEIARAATEELAERLSIPDQASSNGKCQFSMFLHVFLGGATKHQKWRRGAPPAFFLVFWAHSKAVSLNFKNEAEGHRALFSRFLLNFKSGVTLRQK